jgi:hypothetical protein
MNQLCMKVVGNLSARLQDFGISLTEPDKTTDWRNTDHCFLVSWIWKGTCPENHGFSDEAYFKSYWNLTKQPIDVPVVHIWPTSCWSTLFEGVDFFMLHLHQSYGGGAQRSRPPQMTNQCHSLTQWLDSTCQIGKSAFDPNSGKTSLMICNPLNKC